MKVAKVIKGSRTIDRLLFEALDQTMNQVFREDGTKVIYVFVKNQPHLEREEIAKKTEVFSGGLERLLSSAAPVIEKLLLKDLYCKLGLKYVEKESCEFS